MYVYGMYVWYVWYEQVELESEFSNLNGNSFYDVPISAFAFAFAFTFACLITCLFTYLPASLPTYLPTYLNNSLPCLPACIVELTSTRHR